MFVLSVVILFALSPAGTVEGRASNKFSQTGLASPFFTRTSNGRSNLRLNDSSSSCSFAFLPPVEPTVDIPILLAQTLSVAASYLAVVVNHDRPHGKLSVHKSDLDVRPSQVKGAGLGLYATRPLPLGTILGRYPGVLRPLDKYLSKYINNPQSGTYVWRLTDNSFIIDPTGQDGRLHDLCYGGSKDWPGSQWLHERIMGGLLSVPTVLARINEPPFGGDCNVISMEDLSRKEIVFMISRDVEEGEELFMDYGRTYDRSSYRKPKKKRTKQEESESIYAL